MRLRPDTCERYGSEQTNKQTNEPTDKRSEAKRSEADEAHVYRVPQRPPSGGIERCTVAPHRIEAARTPVEKRKRGGTHARKRDAACGVQPTAARATDKEEMRGCGHAVAQQDGEDGGDYALDDDARVRQQCAYAVRHQRVVEVPAAHR